MLKVCIGRQTPLRRPCLGPVIENACDTSLCDQNSVVVDVGFEVLMAVSTKMAFFWVVAPR
jgi:hypothetical protein